MRRKRSGWLAGVGFVAALALAAASEGQTRSGSDRPGSILMFPKVVRSASRDTIVQITNTGNSVNYVHCFYLEGPQSQAANAACQAVDFELVLTRQQPTQWRASQGRRVSPGDAFGSPQAGYDPGLIPPLPQGFEGALVCVEVNSNGEPFGQNRLKGEATIVDDGTGDVSKYNAFALAKSGGDTDNNLNLDGSDYETCPATLHLNFSPWGSLDPVIEDFGNANLNSFISTNLVLLPCDLDFRNGTRTNGTVSFLVRDEFESPFSGSFPFRCWTSIDLGSPSSGLSQFRSTLLTGGAIGTIFAQAQLTPTRPLVGVAESFHTDQAGVTGAAATNLHTSGSANATVRLP